MATIRELDEQMNQAILSGKAMELFETLYADDVTMQENSEDPRVGKDACRDYEHQFFGMLEAFHGATCTNVAVDGNTTYADVDQRRDERRRGARERDGDDRRSPRDRVRRAQGGRVRRALAAVAGLAALVACGSRGPGIDRERAAATFTRVAIDTRGDHGLSGLAVDAGGTMWTVAERGAVALAITLDGDRATAVRYPVRGVPADEDLEAVAIAADGLWVGTEGRERGVARVFHLVRQGDALVATGAPIELRQAEVGVEIGANHGAEGVCGAGDVVAIALETAGGSGAQRWAPIVSVDVAGAERHRSPFVRGFVSLPAHGFAPA